MKQEKAIETQIIYYLRSIGAYVVKVHSGSMMKSYTRKTGVFRGQSKLYRMKLADEGTNDLIGIFRGKGFVIEVKKDLKEIEKWKETEETERRSAAQHYQQRLVREAGGFTLVACSVEMVENDFKTLFKM